MHSGPLNVTRSARASNNERCFFRNQPDRLASIHGEVLTAMTNWHRRFRNPNHPDREQWKADKMDRSPSSFDTTTSAFARFNCRVVSIGKWT
ncbi:hypothetical protein RE6C_04313 [Rhodopirellula europaea 6C]|uniref:Uncharacterized protein n=1 Tax=Rhodopirellula europaea 6C TaxID=1263867 RepID=M2A4Z5_9BACT|nr:hypothetical protein RE6C_04313 [Rhodopirellula europaea 6C]